jgi:hypothetical protein
VFASRSRLQNLVQSAFAAAIALSGCTCPELDDRPRPLALSKLSPLPQRERIPPRGV